MRDPGVVRDRLLAARVVPVLRFDDVEQARFAIDCLLEAGFATVEITLTTPGASSLISQLRARVPETFALGAGTVLNVRQAQECIDAGADYLVAPCVAEEVAAKAHAAGCAVLLGAFTPTEVVAAVAAGSELVKVFPAASGGPSHLAALHAVFPHVGLCPTGGINSGNMAAYFRAGAALVGVGNSIIDRQAIDDRDAPRAVTSAQRYLRLAREIS